MASGDGLSDTLQKVQIHDASTIESDSNPWQDASPTTLARGEPQNPDLSQLDPEATQGLAVAPVTESAHRSPVKQEVLLEFDPLASAEEKEAQQAWAGSKGQPPPLPPPEKVPATPPPPAPAAPNRPSSPIPSFTALAALARTFALPLTRGQRPRSLDSAAAVPSPATLSSFAQQQSAPQPRPLDDAPSAGNQATASGSGRSTPSGKAKESEPPSFDFQRFLDQMKLKGAEPVAKFLRSYVSVSSSGLFDAKIIVAS